MSEYIPEETPEEKFERQQLIREAMSAEYREFVRVLADTVRVDRIDDAPPN